MSLFIRTTPVRLHKQTWAERHRAEILIIYAILILSIVLILAYLSVPPTIEGVV